MSCISLAELYDEENPATMKTLLEITKEHIAKNAALANNPELLVSEAHLAELRMQERFKADPSLLTFVEHYAGALLSVLKIIPPDLHPHLTKSLLAQVVAEWEDVNREWEAQLTNDQLSKDGSAS
jgi:hypothetical protein